MTGRDRAEGKEMSAEEEFSVLEERASMLLREARQLPPGPERDGFLDEIQQYIARLSTLKANGK